MIAKQLATPVLAQRPEVAMGLPGFMYLSALAKRSWAVASNPRPKGEKSRKGIT
jgi:hypothetical protein